MTVNNFQQKQKMSTVLMASGKMINQSKQSRLSKLMITISIGFIFLFALLNLLQTPNVVTAAELQLVKNTTTDAASSDTQNQSEATVANKENADNLAGETPHIQSEEINQNNFVVSITSTTHQMSEQFMEQDSTGDDDDLIVTGWVSIDVTRTKLNGTAAISQTEINVANGSQFNPDQEILIMIMDGNVNRIGRFETATVQSATADKIHLYTPLKYAYTDTTDTVLIQTIPNYKNVIVQENSRLITNRWSETFSTGGILFFRAQTLTVQSGGQIGDYGLGYTQNSGPGTGTGSGSGAAHGGYGAKSYGSQNGTPYGSVLQPTTMGSGGRADDTDGGEGGGIILLSMSHFLQNDGFIHSQGRMGDYNGLVLDCGGGGAGGSIWIHTKEISGTGAISASGGRAEECGQYPNRREGVGGAGGRIALYAEIDRFSDRTNALRAQGGKHAGAGTIYLETDIHDRELWIDNGFNDEFYNSAALVEGSYHFNHIRFANKGRLTVMGHDSQLTLPQRLLTGEDNLYSALIVDGDLFTAPELEVRGMTLNVLGELNGVNTLTITNDSNVSLYEQIPAYYGTHSFENVTLDADTTLKLYPAISADNVYTNDLPFHLRANNLTLGANALLSASGSGYVKRTGPGIGSGSGYGAGHGGYDASGTGAPYGDTYEPIALGSGGYAPGYGTYSSGGGAIHLEISERLQNDGTIEANGGHAGGFNGCYGGGSGGSIWIESDEIVGDGTVEALGGLPNSCGYGGSGGRIALYAQNDQFSNKANAFNVNGQDGAQPGTIYIDGAIDPVKSTLEVEPALVSTDNTAVLSITLITSDSVPIANKAISLTVDSTVPVIIDNTGAQPTLVDGFYGLGTTDANGVVTATMASTAIGTYELIAWHSYMRVATPTEVTFETSLLSGTASDLQVVDESTIPADGTTPAHLRVTARDQFGNPYSNLSASLIASDAAISITAVSTATNHLGYFDFEVRHDLPSTAVFTATIDGNTTIEETATVTFAGTDLNLFGSNLQSDQAAGLAVLFPLTVRNQGYLPAENVIVTATLPSELNFTGPLDDAVVYDSNNHLVIWTIGHIGTSNNAALTLETEVDIAAPINQQISTTIVANTSSTELNVNNNSFTHTLLVTEPAPQISITPATSEHHFAVGQSGVQTLTIQNTGSATAEGLNLNTHYNWVTLNNPSLPQTLAINDTQDWVLAFDTIGVANGRYQDDIEIFGSNVATQTIPTTIYVEDVAQNVTVNVSNNTDAPVSNATVTLIRNTNRDVYLNNVLIGQEVIQRTGLTNLKGELNLQNLPTGSYSMTVTAAKHETFTDTIDVNVNTTSLDVPLVAFPSLAFVGQAPELSVLAGGYAEYQLAVRNNGPGHAEGFSLQLPENLPWMSLALPNGVDRLEAYEQMLVTILLHPEADQALTSYLTGPIIINAEDADPAQTNLTIHVTTGEVGFLAIKIQNELGQPIEGAEVTIVSQEERLINNPDDTQNVTRDWEASLSDADGVVVFNDLSLTDYDYYVESQGYYIEQGTQTAQLYPVSAQISDNHHRGVQANVIQIFDPGESSVDVTLTEDPFYISWSVEETSITDTYAYTVEIEYNSSLNAPAMFISPETFCTPENSAGSDDEDWFIANTGPMTLTNVFIYAHHNSPQFTFDIAGEEIAIGESAISDQYFKALGFNTGASVVNGEVPTHLMPSAVYSVADAIAPGEVITVPFTVNATVPATQINHFYGWTYIQGDYQLTNGDMGKYGNFATLRSCKLGSEDEDATWELEEDGTVTGSGTTEEGADGLPSTGTRGSGGGGGSGPTFTGGPPTIPVNRDVALLLRLGSVTMERQAFRGSLTLAERGGADLEDVQITIVIVDEHGQPGNNSFAIDPGSTVDFGSINGSTTQQWLFVPDDLDLQVPTDFGFIPYIEYTLNGQRQIVPADPVTVTVYPLPNINLVYTHTQPTANGSFYVEIQASNEGYGDARNFNVLLNEAFVDNIDQYGNISGTNRSLSFELMETTVAGAPQDVEEGYVFHFGTIAPSTTITGRWQISVTTSDGSFMLDPVVTRFAVKCRHTPYADTTSGSLVQLTSLISNCDEQNDRIHVEEHEFFCMAERTRILGGPINTATGNYSYVQEGFDLATMGDPLSFNWVYNSLNAGTFSGSPPIDTPLGRGWTYDYNMWLDLRPGKMITLHTNTGTAVHIKRNGDTLTPVDEKLCGGITTETDENGRSTYTLHSHQQITYVFSDTGKLINRTDAQGNQFFFTYDPTGERITQVEEPISGQSLTFTYDETSKRLELVTDSTGRTIDFVYDETSGLLTHVIDPREQQWTYEYTQLPSGEDVMYRVIDPDARIVEETGFDEFGRAITQTYNGRFLAIEYDGQRRIITDGNGGETVLFYDRKNLLVGERDALGNIDRYAFDINDNRIWHENESDAPMHIESNPDGYKTVVENAYGQASYFEYDDRNNMTYMRDARGNETFYSYNEQNQPISVTNQLGGEIHYTYNEQGQVTSVLNENENLTAYGYDAWGRQTVITNALGHTQHTTYNDLGQVISTTDELGTITRYTYDPVGNLIKMTENAWDGQPQNYLNEYNIITEYAYDGRGNQTHMTNTLGFVTRSFYGPSNLLEGRITNWQGTITDLAACQFPPTAADKDLCTLYTYDNEENEIIKTDPIGRQTRTFYDQLNQMAGRIVNWDGIMTLETCQFPPALADQNLCTRYQYNEVGNPLIVTNTVGLQTRTFYNELNRTIGKITNWQGTITDLATCQFPPAAADKDLCTLYEHDEVGQIIVTTDPLGRQTRTFYDALGRVEGTVNNWQSGFTLADCDLSPNNLGQTNVCTRYDYDHVGNQTVVTNALGQKTYTVYDALNRAVTRVENWDGITIINDTDGCTTLVSSVDHNVCSTTQYDALGRTLQSTDALGNTHSRAYDSLGHVITTSYILSNTLVETVSQYDALGRQISSRDARGNTITYTHDELGRAITATSPEGVSSSKTYDAVGRVIQTEDGLNHATVQEYDDLNRPVRIINAEGDTTEQEYDALGNLLVSIDAEGVRTEHEYDDLSRLTAVIDNAGGTTAHDSNIRTEYRYDALGNLLATISDRILDDGQKEEESTEYDQLNRPVRSIDQLGEETAMVYDALGNTRIMTDANGEVTRFTYDGLNRMASINYVADGQTVSYAYDAVGNTRVMTDAIGTTQYAYDDLYRLTEVINPFDQSVRYAYDLNGNRTQLTYPDDKVVGYTYDDDNRLATVTDWLSGTTQYEYDIVGRLITTTFSNGVVSTQQYDHANRLTGLLYEQANGTTVAEYAYTLNKLGFRAGVTETIYMPETINEVRAFIEQNGLLVIEAEHGQSNGDATTHIWAETAVLPNHSGDSYLQALPDIGEQYPASAVDDSPQRSYVISITNPADYTLWVRGMATDAAGDSLHVGLNGNIAATATELTGFIPREWSWTAVTMDNLTATVNLSNSDVYTLDLWMREDGLRIDQLLLSDDPTYQPPSSTLAESPHDLITTQATAGYLRSWVVDYEYDPLQRLTSATYSGDISATFKYTYDPVGNMTAYTETLETAAGEIDTRRVTRHFNDANEMIASTDSEVGTTGYGYDLNGNLTAIMPPSLVNQPAVRYSYDQRNLMLGSDMMTPSGSFAPRMTYAYDGNGQRLRMVDYGTVEGQAAQTTIFTNDVSGLSQVLLSDDGAVQTATLYGADLIGSTSSDAPASMHLSLADALGSVRTEMVGTEVTHATTYGPYGNVFHHAGESGTVYGFTGEETDSSGLIYLRARYYNPAIRLFMSRDPFAGHHTRPQSQNGYSYVEGNPVNYTDPTGKVVDTLWDLYVFTEDAKVVWFDIRRPACGRPPRQIF